MKNTDKQILKSFAVGDKIRFFQSDKKIYVSFKSFKNVVNSSTKNILLESNISSYYFMKDKDNMNIDSSYSPKFLSFIKNEAKEKTPKSEIYYNTDYINLDLSKSFLQYNNRCYFLDTNRYEVSTPYSLNTFQHNDVYDLMSSYITNTYSSEYFSTAQIIDNKSVPIYDITGDTLHRISYIKFKNTAHIKDFLSKYHLDEVKGILFNSETLKADEYIYDSVLIDPIINVINENESVYDNIDIDEIFDDLIANLDSNSFTRMFIPIGVMKSIRNETYSLKENEYMYSISLDTNNLNIPVNYFSLKNLKSPELYQNYNLTEINQNNSIKTGMYDFDGNVIINIFKDYNNIVVKNINNYFNENDLIINSKKYITEEVIDYIINDLHKKYPNFSKETIIAKFNLLQNYLNDKDFMQSYRTYVIVKYGNDIRTDTSLLQSYDLIDKLNIVFDDFIKNIEQYKCTDSLDKKIDSLIILFNNLKNEIIDLVKISNHVLKNKEIREIRDTLIQCKGVYEKAVKSKIFRMNLYRDFIKPILFEVADKDIVAFSNASDEEKQEFPNRMKSKIDDYIKSYENLYEHENEMKISGYLYGFRKYDNTFKNTENNMYLTYNYDTTFDTNLLDDLGIDYTLHKYEDPEKMINELGDNLLSIISSNHDIYILSLNALNILLQNIYKGQLTAKYDVQNYLDNAKFINGAFLLTNELKIQDIFSVASINWIESTLGNLKIFKLADNEYTITLEDSLFGKYFSTLNIVKNVQFAERIKGEHYYKEYKKSKSNVFSLNVRNSGLNYTLYTYNEVLDNILTELNGKKISNSEDTFIVNGSLSSFNDLLSVSKYYKFIEDEKIYFDEVKNNEISTNYKLFKYFIADSDKVDYTRKLIKSKIQIRKSFENAIRKSIHRYMPVNTTLWKIEFSNDEYEL